MDLQHSCLDLLVVAELKTCGQEHRGINGFSGGIPHLHIGGTQVTHCIGGIAVTRHVESVPGAVVTDIAQHAYTGVAVHQFPCTTKVGANAAIGLDGLLLYRVVVAQAFAERFQFSGGEALRIEPVVETQLAIIGNGGLQHTGHVTRAIVHALPIIIAAAIDKTVFTRGATGVTDTGAEFEEVVFRGHLCAHLHSAAGKFGGEFGGIGFLYQHAVDDAGREQIERNYAVDRLWAWQR